MITNDLLISPSDLIVAQIFRPTHKRARYVPFQLLFNSRHFEDPGPDKVKRRYIDAVPRRLAIIQIAYQLAGVHRQRRILSNRNPHDIGSVHLSPHDLLRAFFCTIPVHNSFLSRMVKFGCQKLSRFRELGLKTSTAVACASRIESKCRSDCAVLSFRFSRSQLCQRTATSSLEKKKG